MFSVFSFHAQTPVLKFNGVSDFVDLGNQVGNNIRTIELWFNLEENITPDLNNFVTLVAREISGTNNVNEFALSFQPNFIANSGKLRFDIDGTQPFKSVYSNNDNWLANKWYHVAVVIHPSLGMMMFIDGVKQISTHPYTGATATSQSITALGKWGNLNQRYFAGKVEDVRFSSEALYVSDFLPPCPDIQSITSTIGLWNFK